MTDPADTMQNTWTINGVPSTDAQVDDDLIGRDIDALKFVVSVDGQVIREGVGLESATESIRGIPTSATFAERLCYSLAFAALVVAVGLMAPRYLLAFDLAAAVGAVLVMRRIGLGPLD